MSTMHGAAPRWNVFASELEAILLARGYGMTNLYHAGIYRELVRRLRRSLREPGTFPVLNPSELDRIAFHYQLSPAEIWRLRSAVIATAAERLLYGRIAPLDAWRAAYELLPVLDEAVRSGRVTRVWRHDHDDPNDQDDDDGHDDADDALHVENTGDAAHTPGTLGEESLDLPQFLVSASADVLEVLDDAALAMQMSAQSYPQHERVRWTREALRQFRVAQGHLVQMDAAVRASPAWADWDAEARAGRTASADRLLELTGESDLAEGDDEETSDEK